MEWKRNITITTNESCNLNCIYCYENKKSSKSFNIEEAKVKLTQLLNTNTEGGTTISFHGGEPFLVFEKIRELCDWLWTNDFLDRYRCFATTNGTLIHGEIQDWLYKHRDKFICSLSLDGNREMHNINRSNSFDKIDIPFFIKTWPFQGIKMTISKKTIGYLADGVIYLHNLGIPDIRANLSEMTDWSDNVYVSIFKEQLQKLAAFYLDNPKIKPCSLFNVPFFKTLETSTPKKWCGVGEAPSYDIDSNKLYPCHLFYPSVCGNAKAKNAESFDFSKTETYISLECSTCSFLRICPTCYGANYIERGHPALRDMALCKYNKIRFAIVAEFEYAKIKNEVESFGTNMDQSTKVRNYRIIEGIKKIVPQLNEILE